MKKFVFESSLPSLPRETYDCARFVEISRSSSPIVAKSSGRHISDFGLAISKKANMPK